MIDGGFFRKFRYTPNQHLLPLEFFFVYWLWPSGLLLRDVRPDPDDCELAVPRLVEPVRAEVVRDDLSFDCERLAVLLLDSFMTLFF